MTDESIVLKAGPVGIVLGKKTRADMQKLRFIVSLADTCEYVREGTLRILYCEDKKTVDAALADPKIKTRVSLLGEIGGGQYIAADRESALYLLKQKHGGFKVVDESEVLRLLREASDGEKAKTAE